MKSRKSGKRGAKIVIMIGKEDPEEEVSFKFTDRRKFNSDGSLKDGVVLEEAKAPARPSRFTRAGGDGSTSNRRQL